MLATTAWNSLTSDLTKMLQHFIFALLHLVCDGLTTLMYVSTVHNVEVFV